jgi:hypothetical protein
MSVDSTLVLFILFIIINENFRISLRIFFLNCGENYISIIKFKKKLVFYRFPLRHHMTIPKSIYF